MLRFFVAARTATLRGDKRKTRVDMSDKAQQAVALFSKQIGSSDGHGEWITVDQQRINLFADATLDHQFIHIDPVKSAQLSPYKVTIAHGFLTLSLIPHLTSSIAPRDARAFDGLVMGVNYGLDKVRFPSPVPVNSKLRAERTLLEAELKAPNTIQLKQQVTIEIDGASKPACVAEFLTRLIYA
jgi:acyl dehydratase